MSDETKIGTENLSGKHIVVVLKNTKEDGMTLPAYMVDKCWDGLNIGWEGNNTI